MAQTSSITRRFYTLLRVSSPLHLHFLTSFFTSVIASDEYKPTSAKYYTATITDVVDVTNCRGFASNWNVAAQVPVENS